MKISTDTEKFRRLQNVLVGKPILDTVVSHVSRSADILDDFNGNAQYIVLNVVPKTHNSWELGSWTVYMKVELYKRPKLFPLLELAICDDMFNCGKWIEVVLPNIGEATLDTI